MSDLHGMSIPVEVVASTLADVDAAAAGGAQRVELCVDLACGGLTPGRSLVEAALERAHQHGMTVRVLIRPRIGDFVFHSDERSLMVREAAAVMNLGAEKVVMGGLDANGLPDEALLEDLSRAVGMEHVVFHRALDESIDFGQALVRLKEAGIREVLTSGGHAKAMDGLAGLTQAAQDFMVVAGSGVAPDQVGALVAAGAHDVHASCRVPAPVTRQGRLFSEARTAVDEDKVRDLVAAVRGLDRP